MRAFLNKQVLVRLMVTWLILGGIWTWVKPGNTYFQHLRKQADYQSETVTKIKPDQLKKAPQSSMGKKILQAGVNKSSSVEAELPLQQRRSENTVNPPAIDGLQSQPEAKSETDVVKLTHGNRALKLRNIIFFWTAGKRIKVITLLAMNLENHKVAIITFPLNTLIETDKFEGNLKEFYDQKGQQAVRKYLAKKLEVAIPNYISVDQKTFSKLSDLIGPIQLGKETIDFDLACEQTSTGRRHDDQEVIRAFSKTIMEPNTWIKMPRILWLVSQEVNTNLATKDLIKLYRLAKDLRLNELVKRPLPGDKVEGFTQRYGQKEDLRRVELNTWKNILNWMCGS